MKKKIFTLLALAVLLAGSAFAAGYQISAMLRPDIKVVIDGTTQSFKDASGKEVYPISYNDTTYLPIRAIGGIMGKSVDWDGTTQTIYLGGKPSNMTHKQISDKLSEINSWAVGALWNEAYVNVRDYVESGTDCTGKPMSVSDLEKLLAKLDSSMEKKAGYDSFIASLSDVGYTEVKTSWKSMMTESDLLYSKIKAKKPEANSKDYKFDTKNFVEQRDAFYSAIEKVK